MTRNVDAALVAVMLTAAAASRVAGERTHAVGPIRLVGVGAWLVLEVIAEVMCEENTIE